MKEKLSALRSKYIIDGIQQELTPAQILESVSARPAIDQDDSGVPGRIADESSWPGPSVAGTDPARIERYLERVSAAKKRPSMVFPAEYTRTKVEQTLLDCIWRVGHFGLSDLCLDARWIWNDRKIGNMSALYASVSSLAEFTDALGVGLRYYSEEDGDPELELTADLCQDAALTLNPSAASEGMSEGKQLKLGAASISSVLAPDPGSWVVYIPFDTSSYRFGGSLFAQVLKGSHGVAPAVNDPDYFIDCYEVVRELVEDGIVLAGATVADGGLLTALKGMTTAKTGVDADLSGLRGATGEEDPVRLLFAEVPGALIQIRDIDFDYLDAEMLLQDIAFYPLGHPVPGGELRLRSSARTGIQNILESLIRNQGGEGED